MCVYEHVYIRLENHAYACLDIRYSKAGGHRLMKLKNPCTYTYVFIYYSIYILYQYICGYEYMFYIHIAYE